MTNNNSNNTVNFERLRSSPAGKNGKKRQRRSPPVSPPRGCRVSVSQFPFQPFQQVFPQQAAILTGQAAILTHQSAILNQSAARLYAGFTEPPSPAALPPPPVHWTRTVQSIAVA